MLGRKKQKKIELSAERIEAIRVEVEAAEFQGRRLSPGEVTAAVAPPHLTDAEFLALCMAGTPAALGQETAAHLAKCPECMAEWERLQDHGAVWQDPAAIERLEARRNAILSSADPDLPQVGGPHRASLAALIQLQTAYAAQAIPGPEPVQFPVYGDGGLIPSLTATLQRRDHALYVLITPVDAEAFALYGERSVMLTIADGEDLPPILQREIAIGVAVLLGTNLSLTATSYVQADLIPLAPS